MLRQHALELGVPAGVLSLELHPRRPVGVALGEGLHAVATQDLRRGFGLGAEHLLPVRLSAVAATAEAQGQGAIGVAQPEMQGREGTHRDPGHMGPGRPDGVEDRQDVVGGTGLRVGGDGFRHVRGRVASGIERDRAVPPAEMAQLRFVAAVIPGEFVHEDQRRPGAALFVMQSDTVIRGGARHGQLPDAVDGQPPPCGRDGAAPLPVEAP